MQRILSIEGKFSNTFINVLPLGKGNVFKALDKTEEKTYAIKKIWIDDDEKQTSFEREVQILSLENKDKLLYMVQYHCCWKEPTKDIDIQLGYIQMEYCINSLKSVLNTKAEHFKRIKGNKMNFYEYFISFELFCELTECVNFLHSQNPPIMHRDLKPDNILITVGINGRFLKLCDFGLSIVHQNTSHTENVGTYEFTAPEVINSRNYGLEMDIYSLGIIADYIFEIGLEYPTLTQDQYEMLLANSIKIENMIERMKSISIEERPTSRYLLETLKEIIFPPGLIEELTQPFREFDDRNSENENKDNFFDKYYSARIENLNNRSIISEYDDFNIIKYIESGQFGSVIEVVNKIDKKLYVLKKITIHNDKRDAFNEEFDQLSKLKTDFVVKYHGKWVDSEMKKEKLELHYIRIEKCEFNLKYILEIKHAKFNRKKSVERMDLIEFFISFELFMELTQCINYLHTLNPPLLHKYLNPEKILIRDGYDQRVVLGDFRYLISNDNTLTKRKEEHIQFVAPELKNKNPNRRKATIKSDMYSLGVIGKIIFDADLKYPKILKESYEKDNKLANLYENAHRIRHLLKMLRSKSKGDRPTSIELLTMLNDILFVPKLLKSLINSCPFESKDKETNNFYYRYYQNRIQCLIKRLGKFVTNNQIKETNVYTLLEIANIEELPELNGLKDACLEFEKKHLSKIYLGK